MPITYKLIQTVTVTAATQNVIQFLNIPQIYDDLVIKMSTRTNEAAYYSDTDITLNSESSRYWFGFYSVNNTKAANTPGNSGFNIVGPSTAASGTANVFSNVDIYIPDYKSSNNKAIGSTGAQENDSTSNNGLSVMSNKVVNGTAITSIELDPFYAPLVTNSSASLYGIVKS